MLTRAGRAVERNAALAACTRALGRRPLALAVLVYAILELAYFGLPVLPHPGRVCACSPTPDPTSYMWFLAWWPHALLHGLDPFNTSLLFAPGRVNLGAVDLVPGPAIISTPLTLLFGPVVTYNVWALAGPILSATAAFALCRYLRASVPAALLGGYVYGFSPYELGHLLGHLDLVLIFTIPIVVLLVLRLLDARIGRRAFVALMTLTLAFQLLTQGELMLTLVLLGACALLLAYLLAPEYRSRIRAALPPLLLACALACALTSVFIYEALTGQVSSGFFNNYSEMYVADSLGFLFPTKIVGLGHGYFKSVASLYSGNIVENGVYVGVVLAAIVIRHLATRWASVATRILAAMLALVILLMLGPHLHVAGQSTIGLPWNAIYRLPLLDHVAPVRLGVYMYLLVAIVLATWLSRARAGWRGAAKWAVAVLGVLALVPNLSSGMWRAHLHNPPLFTTSAYRSVVGPDEVTLPLPFAQVGQSMLWQAETGFYFKMADGYVGALAPLDWARDLGSPPLTTPKIRPSVAALRRFLAARGVRMVLLAAGEKGPWPPALAALGLEPRWVDGVLVYRLGPSTLSG